MIGLMILLFFAVYLAVTVWVTRAAANWAKRNNRSPWRWGGLATFIMYNLVFWDFIPTLAAHKYYCATEAGFWVYKTPEQWKKENPKMKEKVGYDETSTGDFREEKITGGNRTKFSVNKRSKVEFIREVTTIASFIKIQRAEESLFDNKNNILLTKMVSFSAGHTFGAPDLISDLRFWANYHECNGENGNAGKSVWMTSVNEFVGLGEIK